MRHYVPRSDAAQYLRIAHNFATGHGISDSYPEVVLHATGVRKAAPPAHVWSRQRGLKNPLRRRR